MLKPDQTQDRATWLNQPEKDVPRSVTMVKTIEDLLFEGRLLVQGSQDASTISLRSKQSDGTEDSVFVESNDVYLGRSGTGTTVAQNNLTVSGATNLVGIVDGSNFRANKSGVRTVTTNSTTTNYSVSISFGSTYPSNYPVPVVAATPQATAANAYAVSVSAVSRSGFTLNVYRYTGGSASVDVQWIALSNT
ncbi:hypothetical protein [Nocardioides sp. Leaf374]|uniref:hypothetical protein n=1 Tax=Nocardioides sp. Leaf374 TaxID=2876560 RepID=UPI001E587C20|nr:hypothetical protein [Nocardioides sp. Leaf374]